MEQYNIHPDFLKYKITPPLNPAFLPAVQFFMKRMQDMVKIPLVNDPSTVHDHDPVCHLGNRPQIMGNKDHRRFLFPLNPLKFF